MAKHKAAQSEISALIGNFTSQVQDLARRAALAQVLSALGRGVSAPAKRGPGRPRGSGAARKAPTSAAPPGAARIVRAAKGHRRTAESVEKMGATLLAHVKAHPGLRAEQIAAALRTSVDTMRLPMQKLLADKSVTTRGQRRGMKYYAAGAAPAGAKPAPRKKKSKRRAPKKAAAKKAKRVTQKRKRAAKKKTKRAGKKK